MIVLGIDTSTRTGSVSLYDADSGNLLAEKTTSGDARHSENLIPDIDYLLEKSGILLRDIDLIGVAIGPGSFTGLRVGLATAKGLSYALKKPLVGVDSLMARAFSRKEMGETAVCLDAMRGEVFGGIFSFENHEEPFKSIPSNIFLLEDFVKICLSKDIDSILADSVSNEVRDKFINTGMNVIISHYNSLYLCILGYIIYDIHGSDNINILSPKYLRDFIPGVPR